MFLSYKKFIILFQGLFGLTGRSDYWGCTVLCVRFNLFSATTLINQNRFLCHPILQIHVIIGSLQKLFLYNTTYQLQFSISPFNNDAKHVIGLLKKDKIKIFNPLFLLVIWKLKSKINLFFFLHYVFCVLFQPAFSNTAIKALMLITDSRYF